MTLHPPLYYYSVVIPVMHDYNSVFAHSSAGYKLSKIDPIELYSTTNFKKAHHHSYLTKRQQDYKKRKRSHEPTEIT